jgi:hypothetical protein
MVVRITRPLHGQGFRQFIVAWGVLGVNLDGAASGNRLIRASSYISRSCLCFVPRYLPDYLRKGMRNALPSDVVCRRCIAVIHSDMPAFRYG